MDEGIHRRTGKRGPEHSARPGAMAPLTIGGLARLAGVGVETIRYYQRLRLLPVPNAGASFRRYPQHVARRIRFIKKAQGVGFTLEEIGTLLDLADGRNRRAVQGIAAARLAQINGKLADLARMQVVLADLLHQCFTTGATRPCPIIESLTEGEAVLARP